jgi:hypothetical protein
MSTTIGTYSPSLLNSAFKGYAAAASSSHPSLAQVLDEADNSSSSTSSTNVTLSDAAKEYLASMQDNSTGASDGTASDAPASTPTVDSLAIDARAWFDDQYQSLGVSSALLDGKVAVDFSSQSRATLSAVASNTDDLFSQDETTAAASELQSRFNTAMASHVVVARHTGDYASLYQAASDYLDQAGADEKATDAWKAQKQAVTNGLSAAKANFGKAPDTGDANDPVQALLAIPSANAGGSLGADATTAQVADNARAMLDDQENAAKDNGTELVFDPSRKSGQQVDFTNFDNRTLATIVLNQDSQFSSDETRAAKNELDLRTRTSMLNSLFPTSNSGSSQTGALGLMQTYSSMSDEEKAVLGVTQDTTNKIMQSYKTQQSVQNTLAAYL